jgi:hypothetical protein
MKAIGLLLILSGALFLDWIAMILAGFLSRALGAGDAFFCSTFCIMGIVVVVLTLGAAAVFSVRMLRRGPSAG